MEATIITKLNFIAGMVHYDEGLHLLALNCTSYALRESPFKITQNTDCVTGDGIDGVSVVLLSWKTRRRLHRYGLYVVYCGA